MVAYNWPKARRNALRIFIGVLLLKLAPYAPALVNGDISTLPKDWHYYVSILISAVVVTGFAELNYIYAGLKNGGNGSVIQTPSTFTDRSGSNPQPPPASGV